MRKSVSELHPEAKLERLAPQMTTPVEISRDVYVSLRVEARRRDTTVPALINRLLAAAVTDKLTAAILDD
jgi:hypothetical protein